MPPSIECRSLHDEAAVSPLHNDGEAQLTREVEEPEPEVLEPKVPEPEVPEPEVQQLAGTCMAPVCTNANNLPEWLQVLYQGVTEVPTYDNFG